MSNLRFTAALCASKLTRSGLKLLGKAATHTPGAVALRLCPDFLKRIGRPETIIGVTGTDGKTTVTNMISDLLINTGRELFSNRAGSNIQGGIASALAGNAGISGRPKCDLAVLEVDERSSRLIYPYIKPDFVVVPNIFSDSIKRNANTEFIFNIMNGSIPDSATLILNADDPISMRLAPGNRRIYFSVDPQEGERMDEDNMIGGVPYCPVCGRPVSYEWRRYHQIGRLSCPSCGFKSPEPDYRFVREEDGFAVIDTPDGEIKVRCPGYTIPDKYNITTAVAMLGAMGVPAAEISAAADRLKIVATRYNSETYGDVQAEFRLAKGLNPVACSRVFDGLRDIPGKKTVIMTLDDRHDAEKTCENVSWLYDTDYQFLAGDDIEEIIIGGANCLDHKVRMLLGGVRPEIIKTCFDERQAIRLYDHSKSRHIIYFFDVYSQDNVADAKAYLGKEYGGAAK